MIDINTAAILYSRTFTCMALEDADFDENGKFTFNKDALGARTELENAICDLGMYDEYEAIKAIFIKWINGILDNPHTEYQSDNEIILPIKKEKRVEIVKIWITRYRNGKNI